MSPPEWEMYFKELLVSFNSFNPPSHREIVINILILISSEPHRVYKLVENAQIWVAATWSYKLNHHLIRERKQCNCKIVQSFSYRECPCSQRPGRWFSRDTFCPGWRGSCRCTSGCQHPAGSECGSTRCPGCPACTQPAVIINNQLEKLEAAKAAWLVCLSLLSLTGSFLALLGLT